MTRRAHFHGNALGTLTRTQTLCSPANTSIQASKACAGGFESHPHRQIKRQSPVYRGFVVSAVCNSKRVLLVALVLRRCTAKHSGIRAALNRPATLLFRFHPNCLQRKFRRFQTIHQAIGSGNAALRNAKLLVTSHEVKAPSLANTSLGTSTEDKTNRTPVRNQSALAEGLHGDKIRSPACLQAERHLVEQASVHRPLHLRGPHIAFLTPKLE